MAESRRLVISFSVALLAAAPSAVVGQTSPRDAALIDFFEKKIRPVLVENCLKCHGETKANAKLRLDSKIAVLKGGVSGPAIVPGDPEKSLLIHVIRRDEGFPRMPKSKPRFSMTHCVPKIVYSPSLPVKLKMLSIPMPLPTQSTNT